MLLNQELDYPFDFLARWYSSCLVCLYLNAVAKEYKIHRRYHLKVVCPQHNLSALCPISWSRRHMRFDKRFLRTAGTFNLDCSCCFILDLRDLEVRWGDTARDV